MHELLVFVLIAVALATCFGVPVLWVLLEEHRAARQKREALRQIVAGKGLAPYAPLTPNNPQL